MLGQVCVQATSSTVDWQLHSYKLLEVQHAVETEILKLLQQMA